MDIDSIAKLARIELSDEEKAKMNGHFNEILSHFEKLNAVNVEGVEPMAHVRPIYNVWFTNDEADSTYSSEILLGMAPEQRDGQVIVPKVVE